MNDDQPITPIDSILFIFDRMEQLFRDGEISEDALHNSTARILDILEKLGECRRES